MKYFKNNHVTSRIASDLKNNLYPYQYSLFKTLFFIICFSFVISLLLISTLYSLDKNALFYNKIGWEYLEKGNNIRAIINFKHALKKNPKFKDAIIGLGKAYLNTEAYEESLTLFNNALKIEKEDNEALNGIGFTMIGLGRYNDALKYFNRVLKNSEENLDAKHGNAYLYFLTGKIIWSKRLLKTIFLINPYHYKSLLLMAEIYSNEKRYNKAKKYIEKAININNKLPDGYIRYGKIFLNDYIRNYKPKILIQANNEFQKALSIQPDHFLANKYMGFLSLLQKNYNEAVKCFNISLSILQDNINILYNLSISHEKLNKPDTAIKYFIKALKKSSSDSILKSKFEIFLISNNYKIAHPLRVKLSNDNFDISMQKQKIHLSDEVILFLRRSILLNPLNHDSRETLKNKYLTLNFYRFYINELKDLIKQSQGTFHQNLLNAAIIKRRERLYHKVGYTNEPPPRDVPRILVLNFLPRTISDHYDAGVVLANYLTFTLQQFGRLTPIEMKKRMKMSDGLWVSEELLGNTLETISEMINKGEIEKLDYIIYGDYLEGHNHISLHLELLNFHNGVIAADFNIFEKGKD